MTQNSVSLEYIDEAIESLVSFFGIKEPVPEKQLMQLINSSNAKGCIKKIALYLGLPIDVRLISVSNNYTRSNSNRFQSDSLVTTDSSGKGTQSITAQVEIPSSFPLFGSAELHNYPINMKISDNCFDYQLTFITIMSHELSHILLRSVLHKEKDNEFYTDLTAMILGFYEIFKIGRKLELRTRDNSDSYTIHTTTYGYLTDVQFEYAYTKIRTMLLKSRNAKDYLISELAKYSAQLSLVQSIIDEFNTLMNSYDLKQSQTFSKEDSDMIVTFHQPDFLYDYDSIIKSCGKFVEEIRAFCEGCNQYTIESKKKIQQYREELNKRTIILNNKKLLLEGYVTRLKKCTTLFYRLKLDIHKKISSKTKS